VSHLDEINGLLLYAILDEWLTKNTDLKMGW
jgi:hypothetical protein